MPWNSSDPFLMIQKLHSDGTWIVIWKSEVIKNNLNPSWTETVLSIGELCNGNVNKPIRITCFDWDSDGSSDLIGQCDITVSQLLSIDVKSFL